MTFYDQKIGPIICWGLHSNNSQYQIQAHLITINIQNSLSWTHFLEIMNNIYCHFCNYIKNKIWLIHYFWKAVLISSESEACYLFIYINCYLIFKLWKPSREINNAWKISVSISMFLISGNLHFPAKLTTIIKPIVATKNEKKRMGLKKVFHKSMYKGKCGLVVTYIRLYHFLLSNFLHESWFYQYRSDDDTS